MRAIHRHALVAAMGLVPVILLGAACSKSIDDPNTSSAVIDMVSSTPTEACIDGDGTFDEASSTTIYTNVPMTFTFQSSVRGAAAPTVWQDVYLTSVDIAFDPPGTMPSQTKAINAQIKANATGIGSVSVVTADDVMNHWRFGLGAPTNGVIHLVFHGKDAGGSPVTVTPTRATNYTVAASCTP